MSKTIAAYTRTLSRQVNRCRADSEATMFSRISIVLLLLLPLARHIDARNKKKQLLPDYVLRAERVLVVIQPDAGEPLTSPTANRTAQEEVEKAIMKWGRFHLAVDAHDADLIITVRKGNKGGLVINHSPLDNRPVILQPTDDGIRVGGRQGGGPRDSGPHMGAQIGSFEDSFEVYRGGVNDPLNTSPVWRYTAKDSLDAPPVAAVEQFRKAIEESEKQSQYNP
jgi:hypothetical protein